jgi:hypothetical protein
MLNFTIRSDYFIAGASKEVQSTSAFKADLDKYNQLLDQVNRIAGGLPVSVRPQPISGSPSTSGTQKTTWQKGLSQTPVPTKPSPVPVPIPTKKQTGVEDSLNNLAKALTDVEAT